MKIARSPQAEKKLQKFPEAIRKKFVKQVALLLENPRHPSLYARKKGNSDIYEARIDYHYRFTYLVGEEEILILTVGMHDEGLGKK